MLNNINKPIMRAFAEIQNTIADSAECSTLEQELTFMVAGGKERIYLNQLATALTGNIINRLTYNVVSEETITVFPVAEGKNPRPHEQSLNASLYMVASYSLLMSGYTNADIIHTALENWFYEDSVNCEQSLDFTQIAADIVQRFILDNILEEEQGDAQLETGERFKAHGSTQLIQELRVATMEKLWSNATPKMKPMLHKLTWSINGTCELKNLTFRETVTQHFVDALNIAGHTGYTINRAIRAKIKRNLNKGVYNKEDKRALDSFLMLDPDKTYYFPHTPDYRGRFYARGGMTTFQGIKELRAAFDFAEHKNVDEYGLFLHIANAYGHDKVSITDRIQWVRDSHMSLMQTPSDNLYAERARLAYIDYKETGYSNVICRIDGTCSGVQLTSGIFLDARTGAAVNVAASSPDDTPADLYGLVADKAITLSKRAVDRNLLIKYHRNITKKVIMILAYGAGDDTLVDTVFEFLKEHGERTSYAKSIKKVIMQAIESDYPAVTRLNEQLQRELQFTPLTQLSYQLSDITVKFKPTNTEHLNLQGTNYTTKLVGKRLPDAEALARGIAPNFVHSLDSELLRKAVVSMNTDLSCIHDDLGLHSCDVRKGLQAVRQGYHDVIKAEPLKELYKGMGIEEEYEADSNGLDLTDVLESAYLFS